MKTVDLDSICDDIYKCIPNRAKFDKLMRDLNNKILTEDEMNKTQMNIKPKTFNNLELRPHNSSYSYQPVAQQNNMLYHNNMDNNFRMNQPNTNNNMNFPFGNQNPIGYPNFVSTLPEGEMLNMKPLQNKTLHRNYTDVHANTKYYYPDEYDNRSDIAKDVQWTDRANNINLLYNTSTTPNRQYINNQNFDLKANRNMLMNNYPPTSNRTLN